MKEMMQTNNAIAFPVKYDGPSSCHMPFEKSGYGVVFEDDGDTGYFYATNEKMNHIYAALHLYNSGTPGQLTPMDKIYIVWNAKLLKAGIYYHGRFQAIVDFQNHRACCRGGYPPASGNWCDSNDWDESMTEGLE